MAEGPEIKLGLRAESARRKSHGRAIGDGDAFLFPLARGGRPAKLTEDDLDVARTLLANPDITVADVADRIGVSPATLYRYIPAARAANAPDV